MHSRLTMPLGHSARQGWHLLWVTSSPAGFSSALEATAPSAPGLPRVDDAHGQIESIPCIQLVPLSKFDQLKSDRPRTT